MLGVFGGSGSTLIAAHKTGRRARIAELHPVYVDRIVRRWQIYAHDDAILQATGETFNQVGVVAMPLSFRRGEGQPSAHQTRSP